MPSQTFNYTGALQTWTVPVGVTSVTVDMAGGAGVILTGSVNIPRPGYGGRLQATYSTTPGTVWNIYVGGAGSGSTGGFNGGGNGGSGASTFCGAIAASGPSGGGATDIRVGGTALSNRIAVAGGGGADMGNYSGGGSFIPGDGGGTSGVTPSASAGNVSGGGGTPSAGGAAGGSGATAGSSGNGGVGGGPSSNGGGPGGGGGYFGGGGGAYLNGAGGSSNGGGGGSGFSGSGTGVTFTTGFESGNGYVTLTWSAITANGSTLMSLGIG